MAELQTVAAAFDVARLAWHAGVFLKRVKDADNTAAEVYSRVSRLKQVLDSVRNVLESREARGMALHDSADAQTEANIRECITASRTILQKVERKVGGFENNSTETAIKDRVKIALRQPGITRLQTDLEARISALQTDLSLLQLADQAHTHEIVGSNQQELLQTLAQLEQRLNNGNKLLTHMLLEQRKQSTERRDVSPHQMDDYALDEASDSDAIESLVDTLQIAESLHERYTSEYAPDPRSIRFNRGLDSEAATHSPLASLTPTSNEAGQIPLPIPSGSLPDSSDPQGFDNDGELEEVWPLEVLDIYIEAYHERAKKELEQEHYNQAELNLQAAIRDSELRERYYNVPFENRTELEEEVVVLYKHQGKFGDAVAKTNQLLCDSTDESVRARQEQLLASIYYERHARRNGSLSHTTGDIENAEKYAKKAFKKRYKLQSTPGVDDRHSSCNALLVRILETRDKTVEANELARLYSADSSSMGSNSTSRIGSNRTTDDYIVAEDKHELLVDAITAGDTEQAQVLLADSDIDIEQLCRQGKTALMWAVEKGDETIVHKLLDPAVGADIQKCNKRGLTALHQAAALGLHDMVRCLLTHDAEIDARDKRQETPLMKAVQNDRGTIVQILFDAGASMDVKNADEWSLLHFAARLPRNNMINQLLDLAPDLKDAVDTAGKTSLHHCSDLDLVDQAAALLAHKNSVDVNALDSVSRSPLYLAASKPPTPRRESMVQLLVKSGARVDETRRPPRYRDYASLNQFQVPSHGTRSSRHDSISTEGSVGTNSTGATRLSRIFSSPMNVR